MVFDEGGHKRGDNPKNRGQFSHKLHAESEIDLVADTSDLHPDLQAVLTHAAKLQRLVPDTVLVGGSAAALYAGHRISFDHDHVLTDLRERFDIVLEGLEREEGWITNRVRPGKIILGQIGDIEAGVRQLIRKRPLETTQVQLVSGDTVTVPTKDETLRIKAFLVVKRNQTRDYLDVAALSDKYGAPRAARVLEGIEEYYGDPARPGELRSQLVRQLMSPAPKDSRTTTRLSEYKGLSKRWHGWDATKEVLSDVASHMGGGVN